MNRILVLLLGVFSLLMGLSSCTSDHNHYYDGVAVNSGYYYYNGYYYADPDFTYKYPHDANHYYYGRLEWKGEPYGYAIVLRENPYYGLVVRVNNPERLRECLGAVYDREVMVRFGFGKIFEYNGVQYPLVYVDHIYYR